MTPTTLSQRWFLWNSGAWSIGFVLYTPIAHGVTGAHPGDLTATDSRSFHRGCSCRGHRCGRAARGARPIRVRAVGTRSGRSGRLQHRVLDRGQPADRLGHGHSARLPRAGIGGVGGDRSDQRPSSERGGRATQLPVASVIIELALVGVVVLLLGITPDLQTSMLQHSIFWITVGGGSGILGGWLSGLLSPGCFLCRAQAAAQQALAGDVAAPRS